MKNFELFGHPDGPRAFEFDIGLPEFFKRKENEVVLIALYVGAVGALFAGFRQLAKKL